MYSKIKAKIAEYSHSPFAPELIAVSKTQSIEAILNLYQLGQRDFGENYVQELIEKATAIQARGITDIRWHMIGHLQSNKIKKLIPFISHIHTIDSLRLAKQIESELEKSKLGKTVTAFIEVNIDEESSKSGVTAKETLQLCQEIKKFRHINLCGLMCIPNPERNRNGESFIQLKTLELSCRPYTQGGLSMGMSSDFELALASGATYLRIGTALFGKRN